jgi:hypothetical protein
VGKLVYCKQRSAIECCASGHECVDSWDQLNRDYVKSAETHLNNTVRNFVIVVVEKKTYNLLVIRNKNIAGHKWLVNKKEEDFY